MAIVAALATVILPLTLAGERRAAPGLIVQTPDGLKRFGEDVFPPGTTRPTTRPVGFPLPVRAVPLSVEQQQRLQYLQSETQPLSVEERRELLILERKVRPLKAEELQELGRLYREEMRMRRLAEREERSRLADMEPLDAGTSAGDGDVGEAPPDRHRGGMVNRTTQVQRGGGSSQGPAGGRASPPPMAVAK